MSSTIEAPRSYDNSKSGVKYNRSSGKDSNFEMFGWVFMRISGIALVVLIFVHLYVNLVAGDGIQAVDFGFVAGKWADPFWQIWDLTMLWLAMLHGTNGVRTIINDYAEKDRTRFWLKMVLYAATVVIVVLGTLVIFTFDPCPSGAAAELLPSFCSA